MTAEMRPEKRTSFPWFALLLILGGIFLLMDSLELVEFGFDRILFSGLIVVGAAKTVQGFAAGRSGDIFWGTAAFLYGIYFLLWTFEWYGSSLFLPASFLVIGGAILMTYLANMKEWLLLLAAFLFLGVGSAMLLGRLEIYDMWQVWWLVRKYWPVLLILAGVAVILRSVRGRRTTA